MDSISAPDTFWELAGRLLTATAYGAAVGLDRELQRRPAGLRTHALVALGAAVATLVGLMPAAGSREFDAQAVSRVLQGIVAGIGFIGAGAILHRGDGQNVQGLTTAAAVWVVAAVGIAAGAGMWRTGLVTVGIALAVLIAGDVLDRMLHRNEDDPGDNDADGRRT